MTDDLEQREQDIRERLEQLKLLPKKPPEPQPDWVRIGALIVIAVALATYLNVYW
jgi:hypothetical protein